jgi:hypothetical protein
MTSPNTAIRLAPITAGASDLNPFPRAIRVQGDGTFTYVNQGADATELTRTVVTCETFNFSPRKITAVSGVIVDGYYGGEG